MQSTKSSRHSISMSSASGSRSSQQMSLSQASARLRPDGSSKSFVKRSSKLGKDGGTPRASIHAKRLLSGKIGKRSFSGYLSRTSKTPHHAKLGHRPKRNAIHRTWDYTAGLSWKEEKELKKALYASLQESKKPTRPTDESIENPEEDDLQHFDTKKDKHGEKHKSLKLKMPDHTKQALGSACDQSDKNLNLQAQVRAQRKFAQGSRPCSPGCSPAKSKNGHRRVLANKKAKTEDFLTFLCLRGSSSLPPHLDFMNNTNECDSLPSFPNTPRHSQDGSRPNTPGTPSTQKGSAKGADNSRCASPDIELSMDADDLGVKPLVGASGRNVAMVMGGGGGGVRPGPMTVSTRASACLTTRYARPSSRCTTNAICSLSELSNSSSFATTSSPASTPSPDLSMNHSPGGAAVSTEIPSTSYSCDLVSASTSSAPPGNRKRDDSDQSRRYATRGKQKTVQEIIAARAYRSSLSPRKSPKDAAPSETAEQIAKRIHRKHLHDNYEWDPAFKVKAAQKTYAVENLRKSSRLKTLQMPDMQDFSKSSEDPDSESGSNVHQAEYQEGVDPDPFSTDEGLERSADTQSDMQDEDESDDNDQINLEGSDETSTKSADQEQEDIPNKLEMATQTSDTSSYTAEIDPSCLIDDETDSDSSDDEEDSEEDEETDSETSEDAPEEMMCDDSSTLGLTGQVSNIENVGESSTGLCQASIVNYTTGAVQSVTSLSRACVVNYPIPALQSNATIGQPMASFSAGPTIARPPPLPQTLGMNFAEYTTAGPLVAQTLPQQNITYSTCATLPMQTCTMVGQGMLLDDNSPSVLIDDSASQVLSNMSMQMQGFSVQQGLSTLPLENVSNIACVQPSLNLSTGPPAILPNALTNCDARLSNIATPLTVTMVPNSLPPPPARVAPLKNGCHGNQALQVNVSAVAMGIQSPAGPVGILKPEKAKSQTIAKLAKSQIPILPRPSPAGRAWPSPVPSRPPASCTATTVSMLDLRANAAAAAVIPPNPVSTVLGPPANGSTARNHVVTAQTQSLTYTLFPLPPPVMAPGVFQPLETPENTPVKSSGPDNEDTNVPMSMEADTTVEDDSPRRPDPTSEVIVINSSSEKNGDKCPKKRRSSAERVKKKVLGQSPEKASFTKRKQDKSLEQKDGETSVPKSGKQMKLEKPASKSTILRSGTRSQAKSDVDAIDLTESDSQTSHGQKHSKVKNRRPSHQRSLSPESNDPDFESPSSSQKVSKSGSAVHKSDTKNSFPDNKSKRRSSSAKRSSMSQEETSDSLPTRRSHLRSATSSPRASPSPSPSVGRTTVTQKREAESHRTMPSRNRTGTIPKAAIRPGFPRPDDPARLAKVPTYHPSAEQFQDPITYIETIRPDAESYGMCKIVPPDGWKPECNISEELRFTTQVQYIHKMADRWGPNVKKMECIKQHLKTQGINLEQLPLVGGVELDLPSLSEAIGTLGGLQHVINKNKWIKVADQLKVPKSLRQEKTSRLYEIYCKYLLSYDTLSEDEQERLEQKVENRQLKNSKLLDQTCTSKGRSKPLGEFFRAARNTQSMWFNEEEPTTEQVEELYWELVSEKSQHVMVQVAHIDTKHCGSAFPSKKDGPYSRHGWNYNILRNHPNTVLAHLGQVTGLTVPMLHIGMIFSTSCWARDPHFLPYIVYSHTGADVIWYCIPSSEENKFKDALDTLAPRLVDSQSPIWLPEDTVMVEPSKLLSSGVSLCQTVQHQGEFVIVFPKSFTATVTCGYNISESLHFATPDWLSLGCEAAELLHESCEPDLFSMERLLVLIATTDSVTTETLQTLLPSLEKVIENELALRKRLGQAGLQQAKKVKKLEELPALKGRRRSVDITSDKEVRCDVSSKICFLSMVVNEQDNRMFGLQEALQHMRKKKNLRNCKLLYVYDQKELCDIVQGVQNRISTGSHPGRRKSLKSR